MWGFFAAGALPVDDIILPGFLELVLVGPDDDAVLQVRHAEDDLHVPFDDPVRGAGVKRGDASVEAVVGARHRLRQPGGADVGHALPLELAFLLHHVGVFPVDEQDPPVGSDLEQGRQPVDEEVLVQPLRALVLEIGGVDDHPRRCGGVAEHRVGEHVADHLVRHARDVLGLDAGAPDQARGGDVLVGGGRARRVLHARRRTGGGEKRSRDKGWEEEARRDRAAEAT